MAGLKFVLLTTLFSNCYTRTTNYVTPVTSDITETSKSSYLLVDSEMKDAVHKIQVEDILEHVPDRKTQVKLISNILRARDHDIAIEAQKIERMIAIKDQKIERMIAIKDQKIERHIAKNVKLQKNALVDSEMKDAVDKKQVEDILEHVPDRKTLVKLISNIFRARDNDIAIKDQKIERLIAKNVKLQENARDLKKYVLILSVRSRIEELERTFLGESRLQMLRKDKWNRIMCGVKKGLHYQAELALLRARVDKPFRTEFVNTIDQLYGDFSDLAAHNVKYPVQYDRESIAKMLQIVHISPDERKIDTVVAILKPLR